MKKAKIMWTIILAINVALFFFLSSETNGKRLSHGSKNLVLNNYKSLDNVNISGGTFNTPAQKQSVRTISVPVKGGKVYVVRKDTPTIMRVASGAREIPVPGTRANVFVEHKTPSDQPLEIPTLEADRYLYIQLFTVHDEKQFQSLNANLKTLAVNELDESDYLTDLNEYQEINHRGYDYVAPENTLAAFRLSKKMFYNWIETDIRSTSDGVIVLLHDAAINRTARGSGGKKISEPVYIKNITYANALKYDFGIWKSPAYAGEKIPTLAQALSLCKDIGLKMTIEIKSDTIKLPDLIELVKQYGMTTKVEYMSNNKNIITNMSRLVHNGHIGYNGPCDDALQGFLTALRINGNTVYYHTDTYAPGTAKRAILDKVAADNFVIVSRAYSKQAVINAPPYSRIFITNRFHPKKILHDAAVKNRAE